MIVIEDSLLVLFEQLGLPADNKSISHFIEHHSLTRFEDITEASFWNQSQKQFLLEARSQDADWVYEVDLLDSLLRK